MAAATDKDLERLLMEVGVRLADPPLDADVLFDLLDQTETFLSRVDQSPSQSMFAALRPAMDALVAKNLLEHSDMDVKVAVASCISEVTRITAPDAPYDDDMMKVIFQMIVEAFEKLDDTSSRSYSKRVSILETVAKVRSSVVMLDLECDALILEMFNCFLKTIRPNHPENIFSSMEMIMSLVIEESEDISSELLSCLVDSIKKDNKELLPIAHMLGEKVISNCIVKLKPYLIQVPSLYALCEGSKIVASICQKNPVALDSKVAASMFQENSDALEQNETNISGEPLVDDNKLSERTVSDELPQGSTKTEQEVCSEKVASADKPVMSNGNIQRMESESVVEPASPNRKSEQFRRCNQSKNNVADDKADPDNLESVDVKSDSLLDITTTKAKEQKPDSSVQTTDPRDYSQNDSGKDAPSVPVKLTAINKEGASSAVDVPSGKEAESIASLEPEDKIDMQPPLRTDNGGVSLPLQTPSKDSVDTNKPKRGRPSGSKVSKKGVNAVADKRTSSSGEKGAVRIGQVQIELEPSKDIDLEKELEGVSNSEGKPGRLHGKNVHLETAADVEKVASLTSDSEAKPVGMSDKRVLRKKVKGDSSGKKQKSHIKLVKAEISVEKDSSRKSNLKDMTSTNSETNMQSKENQFGMSVKTQSEGKRPRAKEKDMTSTNSETNMQSKENQFGMSVKTQSEGKRPRAKEKISETSDDKPELDESLVGSKIKVWWPDDNRFYDGRVDSFDPINGRHTIVYVDGDTEVLLLKEERIELIRGGSEAEGDQAIDVLSPLPSPEMRRSKKAKANSGSEPKQGKRQTPLKSGELKSAKRPRGRPKSGSSSKSKEKAGSRSKDDTPQTGKKSNKDTAKPGGAIGDGEYDAGVQDETTTELGQDKDAPPKSRRKSKGEPHKSSSKLQDDPMQATPKIARKSKDVSVGTGKKAKSSQATPKVGRKAKLRGDASPQTMDESSVNATSEKCKEIVEASESTRKSLESETPDMAQGGWASTGKKRKRKGYN